MYRPLINYLRDKDGREVDFLVPAGGELYLYECKLGDHSGTMPANVRRLLPVFGDQVGHTTVLTTVPRKARIDAALSVSNVVEL